MIDQPQLHARRVRVLALGHSILSFEGKSPETATIIRRAEEFEKFIHAAGEAQR